MSNRTEKTIIEAFNSLISKTDFEKLTVSMIIEEANVSRATFYRYFQDKYDVMNANFKQLLDSAVNSTDCHDYCEMFEAIVSVIQSCWGAIIKAFDSTGVNSFRNFIYSYSYDTCVSITKEARGSEVLTPKEKLQLEVYCTGLSRSYEMIALNNCRLSSREIAEALLEIAPPTLKIYWRKSK